VHGADGADLNPFTSPPADGAPGRYAAGRTGEADGYGTDGYGADGSDAPNASASNVAAANGTGSGEVRAGAGQTARSGGLGVPWPPATATRTPHVPEARRAGLVPSDGEPPTPTGPGSTDATGPWPVTAGIPTPPGGAVSAALPQPRSDEATAAAGIRPAPNGTGGRGLRRRVPQSHLTPELRHPGQGGLADTAAPLSADAAATALSRYQASRLAAQAVVEGAGPTSSSKEGERP